jgi:hypothetical protein
MQNLIKNPLWIVALVIAGILLNRLARFIFTKNPQYCKGFVIVFGVIMLGGLIFFLILLASYE